MRTKIEELVAQIQARFLAEAPEFYSYIPPVELLSPPSPCVNFGRGEGLDRDQFIEMVRAEYAEYVAEYPDAGPVWVPDKVVLKVGRVLVLYMVRLPTVDEARFGMADIRSADGRQFTAGELLWEVYRATAKDVLDGAHLEFEGLKLVSALGTVSRGLPAWVPVYQMYLGS
jgi:hypothetical protein